FPSGRISIFFFSPVKSSIYFSQDFQGYFLFFSLKAPIATDLSMHSLWISSPPLSVSAPSFSPSPLSLCLSLSSHTDRAQHAFPLGHPPPPFCLRPFFLSLPSLSLSLSYSLC